MSVADKWNPRYLVHNEEKLIELIREDQKLLKHFGAYTIGFSPGVTIQIGEGPYAPTVELNDAAWNWLRPILEYCRNLEEHLPEAED